MGADRRSKQSTNEDGGRTQQKGALTVASLVPLLLGILLITWGLQLNTSLREGLIGIGAAVAATGPISFLIWWITDNIYRAELKATIGRQVSSSFSEAEDTLTRFMDETVSTARQFEGVGLDNAFLARDPGLAKFRSHISAALDRARGGQEAFLWFAATDMRGFIDSPELDARQVLIEAARLSIEQGGTLQLRILLANPEFTASRGVERAPNELRKVILELDAYGVPRESIRLYAFRPTLFGIATATHMLLNPYPNAQKANKCLTLIVRKLADPTGATADRDGIYEQYLRAHFSDPWEAPTTRVVDDPRPPILSHVRLSADEAATNDVLSSYISEGPVQTADLLEFSGQSMIHNIEALLLKGATVRLLLKDPRTVGQVQRDKISMSYRYLWERVSVGNYDPELLKVRFYDAPASLRGRRVGDGLINLGWYTPEFAQGGRISEHEVVEHRNPTVTSNLQTPDGHELGRMFEEVFSGLWEHASEPSDVRVTGEPTRIDLTDVPGIARPASEALPIE